MRNRRSITVAFLVAGLLTLTGRAALAQEELTITKVYSPTSTDLTLVPGSDVVLSPVGKDVLPGLGYDTNLGALTKKYLTLHAAELWVETLVAQNTLATIGGRILVGPTTTLTADLSTSDTAIRVKHNSLTVGDRVYLEADGKVEFMAVTSGPVSGSGYYEYGVTRNLDGSGANLWYAGDAVFNTGQTGNGFIDLYSVRGVKAGTEIGPTIVGNVRLSSTYNDWAPRWAIGQLNGLYGYSSSTYGAAFGVPGGARVTVDSTNGIRIFGGDNDEKVTIDTSGNATFDGKLTVGTGRNIIRNSECRVTSEDWAVSTNTGLGVAIGGPSFSPWRLNDEANGCYVNVPSGTPAAGTFTEGYLVPLLYVTAGKRYEVSGYVGLHRATSAEVYIQWINSSAAIISSSTGANLCTTSSSGGVDLASWCRTGLIATAPTNAVTARVVFRMTHDGTNTTPHMFWVRSFFAEATTAQEDLTEWGPAGLTSINGGIIETNTITANKISVSTLSAITANVGTLTGGTIDGVTMKAGSGDEVVLDSSGITLLAGTGTNNKIKWSDGTAITGSSNHLYLASSNVHIGGGAYELLLDSSGNFTEQGIGDVNIGTSSLPFLKLYVQGQRITAFSGANHFVCHDNNGDFYSSATTCDGSAPSPEAFAALERELMDLREQVRRLEALIPAATPATEHPPAGVRQ